MDLIVKKASAYSAAEKTVLGITGIPANWPIESAPYTGTVPAGFEQMTDAELAALKANNQASYDAWLASLRPAENPLLVTIDQLTDEDDAMMARPKYAPPGWTYQMRSVEFETSKRASLLNQKVNPATKAVTDWGDATLKFFKADGTELVQNTGESETDAAFQARLDTDCEWTQVDFEPVHDMEIVGGAVRLLTELTTDVYLWIIGVPDLPEAFGGTKFFVSGVNLNYIPAQGNIQADGRTSKKLTYSATYHTNKMRALIKHTAGVKHRVQLNYEFYRS